MKVRREITFGGTEGKKETEKRNMELVTIKKKNNKIEEITQPRKEKNKREKELRKYKTQNYIKEKKNEQTNVTNNTSIMR